MSSVPPSPTSPPVQPVTPIDRTAAAQALARAFVDDPVWNWLTDDRIDDFAVASEPFFAAETKHYIHRAGAWATEGNHAVALWAPPKTWRASARDIADLLVPSTRLFGARRTLRALSALSQVEKKHPTEPHWYLGFLGTDPPYQGKGYGAAVLRPVLDRCDRDGSPAYLESSKESNVPFYERHGFAVTGTHVFPDGPTLYLMWREPRPPSER